MEAAHFGSRQQITQSDSVKPSYTSENHYEYQPQRSDQEKCLIAWDLCIEEELSNPNEGTDSFSEGFCQKLKPIFNDLSQLDFTLVGHQIKTVPLTLITAFKKLLNFASHQFIGNAIIISGREINQMFAYEGCRDALCSLISKNHHLTSISFENINNLFIDQYRFESLFTAIEANQFITKLSFKKCWLTSSFPVQLHKLFEKSSSVKTLHLEENQFTTNDALELLSNNTLTSLNLKGNSHVFDSSLLEGVEKNRSLISLTVDWSSKELKEKCEAYLSRNFYEQHDGEYHFYRFWSLTRPGTMPSELLKEIFSTTEELRKIDNKAPSKKSQ